MRDYKYLYDNYINIKSLYQFIIGQMTQNEDYCNYIYNRNSIMSCKMIFTSLFFTFFEEEAILKENNKKTTIINDEDIKDAMEMISTISSDNKCIIDGKKFNSYVDAFVVIRNKIAHGEYKVNFENGTVDLFVSENNIININISDLSVIIVKIIQSSLVYKKELQTKRSSIFYRFDPKESNRSNIMTTKTEFRTAAKKFQRLDLSVEKTNGEYIDKSFFEFFSDIVGNYATGIISISDLEDYKKNLLSNGYKFNYNISHITSSDFIDKISKYGFENLISDKINYSEQLKYLGSYANDLTNKNAEKANHAIDIFQIFNILNFIEKEDGYNEDNVNNYFKNEIGALSYKHLGLTSLALFTALFSVSYDNVFDNNNEFSDLNDGFPYDELDLSDIIVLKEKIIKLENFNKDILINNSRIEKFNELIEKKTNSLEKVIESGNEKAKQVLLNQLNDYYSTINDLNSKNAILNRNYTDSVNYYNNNKLYYKKQMIIEGIRNSISHGHVEFDIGSNSYDSFIIFKDIFNGELTFECKVNIDKFFQMIQNSESIVFNYYNKRIINEENTRK